MASVEENKDKREDRNVTIDQNSPEILTNSIYTPAFLRDWKSALVIGVSITASIMATFAMMYITGITMNMISTGGIVIGIGTIVDNSVVVLENINTYHQRGYKPYDAALKGTQEVAMAVTASTLTSVAVFLPIAFVPGTIGSIVKDLSYTICYALLASLVVSITILSNSP